MKNRRWQVAAVAVLAIGAVLYHASWHQPTGPAAGTEIQGAAAQDAPPRRTIRIGQFNIHAGKGLDGRRDLTRTAECLRALDLVGLNEVRGPWFWQTDDQAAQLGRELGMQWLFAPSIRVWYHMDSGNGLLSSLPVVYWQRIPLPREHDHSYRNLVLVGLEHEGRIINVLLTHISRRYDAEREAQLRTAIALFVALREPAILTGDMNTTAEDPQIRQLLETPGVADPVGQALGQDKAREVGRTRIDWIFVRGLRGVGGGILKNDASDHPMVWAELELEHE